MPESSRTWMEAEEKAVAQAQSVVDAAKMAAVVSTAEQVEAADVTTGAALFDLSSYTGGAPLIPMGDGATGVEGPSAGAAADASHGMFEQDAHELMDKSSYGEEKKMGRPSHPAWQYFIRGEKRNRFHHNAYCRFCNENGEEPVAVRGVSGNMIRHLQKCIYCPAEVVTQLKLLCAQKDAASFNKRHQSQNRSVDVFLQETSPAPKKKSRRNEDEGEANTLPLRNTPLRGPETLAAKASIAQDTTGVEDFMPLQLPLLSSEMNGGLTTTLSSSKSLSYERQLREAATKQHYERLMTEKQRQHEALNLVAQMEEEERNLRLRLEALNFHREYMEQELSLHDSVTQVASDAAEPFHILLAASLVNLLSRPRPKQRYTMEKSEPTFSWAPLLERMMRRKPMQVIQAEENSQDLPRSLSLFDLICIGIGGTVGSGIFSTAASIVSDTAGPSAVISWLIGGVVCCMNALAYMELTTRIPSSGSTYAYAYHAIGEMPAVVAGWLLTLEYAVSGAGVARSWAQKVEDWVILEHPDASVHWLNLEYSNILSAVIQGLCVVVLLAGLRFGKMFVNGFTILKLFVVIFIIIAGFCAIDADNLSPFIPARAENSSGDMAYGTQGIITGATQAFFGYIGFDEVCCLAAEAKNPKKVMPVAVLSVVTGTAVLSVLCSLVLSGMVPYSQATSFPDGFSGVGWDWASQIVRAGETITMPVVVLIAFLAQPRLNYALACDGLMPEIFAKVDAKGNLFVNTLITGIFFTLVAFVVPFVTLWDIVNFGILISFVMSNSSLMMIRMSQQSPSTAPKYIGSAVALALMTAFFYQQGYVTHDSTVCLVIAIVCLVATVAMTIVLAIKCPQSGNDPLYFSAPLVPFIPMICILADFYLVAQIPNLGLILGVAWVLVGVLSYFVYGQQHAASRNGWAELLQYHLPSINSAGDDSYVGLRPSLNEVRPSMNSMVKDN
ncbi:hypothetical protein JG687_00004565 [Phytophthora cactorum]|uniref:Cationic amino acid transporter C-terminal domain-containing protein n=2 Tax=Phytophthora cactorum TaxID=29920 RepID=A0A8T1UNA6_9STRA|nr:hypothetical protein JG687_00004565 [Phytophthora cactorum]